MGVRVGYEYCFRFSMVEQHDINSVHKLCLFEGLKHKLKLLLFEIRTNFILKTRRGEFEEDVAAIIIDSEKYDAYTFAEGDEQRDASTLYYMAEYRLLEYWMTQDEIDSLVKGAVAFANRMAAQPEHAHLILIPTVVDLEVRTVQQDGESFDAAMDRAIRAHCLVPLYLWPQPSMDRKLAPLLRSFLRRLKRVRVEDVDVGLGLMQACPICSRKPSVGAQLSSLPCGAFFHSHCIVRWSEDNKICPGCPSTLADHVSMSPLHEFKYTAPPTTIEFSSFLTQHVGLCLV